MVIHRRQVALGGMGDGPDADRVIAFFGKKPLGLIQEAMVRRS